MNKEIDQMIKAVDIELLPYRRPVIAIKGTTVLIDLIFDFCINSPMKGDEFMIVKILNKDTNVDDKLIDEFDRYGQGFIPKHYEKYLIRKCKITEKTTTEEIEKVLEKEMKCDIESFAIFKQIVESE